MPAITCLAKVMILSYSAISANSAAVNTVFREAILAQGDVVNTRDGIATMFEAAGGLKKEIK